MHRQFRKIDQFFYDIQLVEEVNCEDAEVVVIAYGCVAFGGARRAHGRERGVKAGFLKLKTLSPSPRRRCRPWPGSARRWSCRR
jgi:2-oxoglutarate ferredoxin oxidoreductase, alpha subunit (EC 1.2.7.3)